MFLSIEENKIKVSDEGWLIPSVKELYDSDKSDEKEEFNEIMTALYFIYKPDTIFENLSIHDREREVSSRVLKLKTWDEYMKNPLVKDVAELYKKLITTPSIRNLERIKDDIEKLHDHLSNIPMEYEEDVEMIGEVIGEDGKKHTVRRIIRAKFSNIEEKEKVYNTFLRMQQMYEKIKAIVEKELIMKKVANSSKRIFDKQIKTPHSV